MELLWNVAWPYLVLIAVGTVVSWPPELRQGRWLQIGLSCVVFYYMRDALRTEASWLKLEDDFETAWIHWRNGSIAMAVFWSPNLAWYGAWLFSYFVDDPDPDPLGYVDSGMAQNALRRGEFKEAVRLADRELERDPVNYECLLIKATAHSKLRQRWRACRALRKIIRAKRSTEAQQAYARQLLTGRTEPAPEPIQVVGLKISKWSSCAEEEE
jgi:hypothetical protein